MSLRKILSLFLLCSMVPAASAQTDDFTDNNDAGWTRLDPLGAVLGTPYAAHEVQSGHYRLSCPPSPNPRQAGAARVASYRADAVLADFTVVVDVVAWNAALDQSLGFLARIQPNPGPGALNGYALNYQPFDHDLEINLITGEKPFNLARVPLNLVPGDSYRFVFTGTGGELKGAVYSLAAPLLPLTTVEAADFTYEDGHIGLFAFDTSGTGAVDATFDNYTAGPAVPPTLALTAEEDGITLEWPRRTGFWHLEWSSDLTWWEDVTAGGTAAGETMTYQDAITTRKFFRLAEGWPIP